MSAGLRRLLERHGWAVAPTVVSVAASGTAAGTTLLVAWGLGAAAFGRFALVLSIALVATVGMLMSLHFVMYRELPRAAPARHPALVTTALFGTLGASAGLAAASLAGAPLLTRLLGVDLRTLGLALALAFSTTALQLAESFLRGLGRPTFAASLKLGTAAVYLAVSAYLMLAAGLGEAEPYLVALIATNLLYAVAASARLPVARRAWSAPLARTLYRHGAQVSAIATLTGVLFGVDVVFLNHWAGAADVGVYSIYNGFPKRLLGVVFTEGIGLVLLPVLATAGKPALLRRLARIAPVVGAAAAGLSLAASAVFFLLLREAYPYSPGLMALSAAGIGVHTVFNLYFFALTMDGVRGARVFLTALAAATPAALAGQAVLIARWGMTGGLAAFVLTNLILLAAVVAGAARAYRGPPPEV